MEYGISSTLSAAEPRRFIGHSGHVFPQLSQALVSTIPAPFVVYPSAPSVLAVQQNGQSSETPFIDLRAPVSTAPVYTAPVYTALVPVAPQPEAIVAVQVPEKKKRKINKEVKLRCPTHMRPLGLATRLSPPAAQEKISCAPCDP